MKKIITLIILMLLTTTITTALEWTNYTPTNGTTIPGSQNQQFTVQVNETIQNAYLYLNGAGPYTMQHSQQQANTTKDVLLLTEHQWYQYYYIINGFTSPTQQFYLDKHPTAPTWQDHQSTETTVTLNWNTNQETDIQHYTIYKNNNQLTTTNQTTYTDNNVNIGQTYNYTLTATDNNNQESTHSTNKQIYVQDATPPATPHITITNGNCNAQQETNKVCDTTALNPTFTIDYSTTETENVTLKILSGPATVYTDKNKKTFTWPFSFGNDGTYMFNLNATDQANNTRTTPLTVMVQNATVIVDVTIHDINQITNI